MKYAGLFVLLFIFGCTADDVKQTNEKEIAECPSADNVEHYSWITSYFQPGCGVCAKDVYTSTYRGQKVIYVPCGGLACDCLPGMYLYDCQGKHVATLITPAEQAELGKLVKIYSCN